MNIAVKVRALGVLLGALALGASQVPGCAVTETGNPKTVMGFSAFAVGLDDSGVQVTKATLSLESIELLDASGEPVATPNPGPEAIDLLASDTSIEWTGREDAIEECKLSQTRLELEWTDADGEAFRLLLRGDLEMTLNAVETYALDAGSASTLAYDLVGFVQSAAVEALLAGDTEASVDIEDGVDGADASALAEFVGLYPDDDADGMVSDAERAAPLALGER